jgi:hypothetical protein
MTGYLMPHIPGPTTHGPRLPKIRYGPVLVRQRSTSQQVLDGVGLVPLLVIVAISFPWMIPLLLLSIPTAGGIRALRHGSPW